MYKNVYSYQKSLDILIEYLHLKQIDDDLPYDVFVNDIADKFLFADSINKFNKIINEHKLYKWFNDNNIDLLLDEFFIFIKILKKRIINPYYTNL
jgi:hypothetical protein